MLFFSGYHNIIRRNSSLIFHEGFDPKTGKPIDDDLANYVADRIVAWGNVTRWQIWTLLHSAPPTGGAPSKAGASPTVAAATRSRPPPEIAARLGGENPGYSPDLIAWSSRKRISSSLLVCEITKRTRPWLGVSA